MKKPKKGLIDSLDSHSEDDGEGNWLVSYADMMTLLFGFFVIISSFSDPNPEKIEAMKKATAENMGTEYKNIFEDLSKTLKSDLEHMRVDDRVKITETLKGVTLTAEGTFFFESGAAELSGQALELVENVSKAVSKSAKGASIVVEGHTDTTPIVTSKFPSNWELSSARASAVVRILESYGVARKKLLPLGFADTQPVVEEKNSSGQIMQDAQAKNRRIVIHINK